MPTFTSMHLASALCWTISLTSRDYWKHLDGHRLSAKIAFITACNKQVIEGSLSDTGRQPA
ncbi:hypothetical protein G7009_03625 [Pseudomonas capeferrum]|uniref:hypothetical protein n=1 Tax=Pseudomonas capeferrum TaxID=1495066 RepID=UPI0015E2D687|nr:hypothetical protein [Pseudomonas capeferrum]MBA1200872.1 hypothetical protein [Pseudomonas capeferrum]